MGELLTAAELEGAQPLLTDADLEGAKRTPGYPNTPRMSRDPARKGQPESVQEESERLGIDTGPIRTIRVPVIGGILKGEPSPVGTSARQQWMDETVGGVQKVENAAGTAAAGGIAGALTKAVLAARAAGGVGTLSPLIRQGLENSFAHGGTLGIAAKIAQAIAPKTVGAVTSAVTKGIPAAVGAGTVGTAALAPSAINILRERAASDPRAAEALAIASIMQPDFTQPPEPVTPATQAPPVVTPTQPNISPEKSAEALKIQRDRKLADKIASEIEPKPE